MKLNEMKFNSFEERENCTLIKKIIEEFNVKYNDLRPEDRKDCGASES